MDSLIAYLDAQLASGPVLVAGPASESAVAEIEAAAGFALPADYREFVARYGAAIVGPYSVYGAGGAEAMGNDVDAPTIRQSKPWRGRTFPRSMCTGH